MALLAADARGLVAAERGRRVAGAPGVDVDGAGAQQRGELVGLGDVAGPEAGREAVLGVVGAPATSSRSSNGWATRTGPKISSRAIFISSETPVNRVGSMK